MIKARARTQDRAAGWQVLRLRRLPISVRIDRRAVAVVLALAALTVALMIWSIGTGEYRIAPLDVLWTILGRPVADADYTFVVRALRLPRTLVAALVGIALALSGAIMQGLTRNPLASPEITGVTGGASLAAVALIVWLPAVSLVWLPVAALGGGLAVAVAIYALAWRGGDSPLRLILVGIGIGAVLSALITLMLTFGEVFQVQRALVWLTGSVYGRTWADVRSSLPWLALGVPAVLVMARHLDVLQLGPDVARGLGSAVEIQRAILLLLAVMLAAVSVTVAGTIGFVGLMAPHIARRLVGPAHAGMLPTAALVGALLVVAADLAGRTLFAPIEIPCGIVTAAVGAPFFLYVLYRRRERSS